jgi:hypothetical protein
MDLFLAYLRDNPWIWAVLALGVAVWAVAVALIFRSEKFVRKWLWVLLTLANFSFGWSIGPGSTVSIGFPIGALYVLWFWRYGRPPTAETLANARAKRNAPAPTGPIRKLIALRAAYAVAVAAALTLGWYLTSGQMDGAFLAGAGSADELQQAIPGGLHTILLVFAGVPFIGLTGAFTLLAFRPYWWGKVLCAMCGISWTMFSLASAAMPGGAGIQILPLAAGAAVFAAAIVHQIVDPRFSGSYLRQTV